MARTHGWLITHKNCLDGATAALAGEASGLTPIFVEPDRVEEGLSQVTDDRPVYLADVSLRPDSWAVWRLRISFVLDHHQSALHLLGQPNVRIDQAHSGGWLMYAFAVERGWLDASPAWERLCRHVERYDLWKPQHEFGQDLNRLFHALGYDWYRQRFANGYAPLTAHEGDKLAQLIREERAFVARHIRQAVRYQNQLPYPIFAVELDEEGPVNIVSHTLLEQGAALVLTIKPDQRLSARTDARIDAAQLMEHLFQGGGHPRASGGRLPADEPADAESLLRRIAEYLAVPQPS
ncbi:DHHA1 domain-containing protein [Sulfobacillus harzensis]|uniref:DHHA1 domain-containing protein n=1 Tax=Sulfobacillus harzensis TaxID=2729629 RepID=UPI0030846570